MGLLSVLSFFCGWGQLPVFKEHKPEDWGDTPIQTFFQDSHGQIWMGGGNRVFSYDGQQFDYYQLADSCKQAKGIRAIGEWNHQIWVGFGTGKVATLDLTRSSTMGQGRANDIRNYHRGDLRLWEPEEGCPAVPITGFASSSPSLLWMSTYGEGLYAITPKRVWQFNREGDALCSDDVYDLEMDAYGRVWVATDQGVSICSISKEGTKTVQSLTKAQGMPDEVITSLAVGPDGWIWMGSNNAGIWAVHPQSLEMRFPFADWQAGEIRSMAVFSAYEIWCSTSEAGLVLADPSSGRIFPQITRWSARQLQRDREGQLWALSDHGKLRSANLQLAQVELPAKSVQAVCTDPAGRLWAGTTQGLWCQDAAGWRQIGPKDLNVLSLLTTPRGHLWAGTFGDGIYVFDEKGQLIRHLDLAEGLPNGSILSMAATNQALVSTLGGLIAIDWDSWKISRLYDQHGRAVAADVYIYKVLVAQNGTIWMGTDGKGLCRLEEGEWFCYENALEVSLKKIYSIAEDKRGRIWFSGENTGLFKLENGAFTRYSTEDHLHSMQINSLTSTPKGYLVLGYEDGVELFLPERSHFSFHAGTSGLPGSEYQLNAVWSDEKSQVWLGSNHGISRVAGFAREFATDPATAITAVVVSGRTVQFQQEHLFPHDQNQFLVEFRGIWLTNPDAVYYRYQLEGYDPDWVLSRDRVASYPNLPPGNYRFRVQSTEHGRFEGVQEAVYAFTIQKPFWMEWWFWVIATGGLVAGFWFYLLGRERRVLREQALQREKMSAQLTALKAQINPHFLFNSLNTLVAIIEEQPGQAVQYVQHLADFYRSILIYREKDLIPLEDELKIANDFVFLLKRRYESALEVQLPETVPGRYLIFPLVIQMLIENAVKHNVISQKQPLRIRVFIEDGPCLTVQNNLNPKKKPEEGAGFGLQSIAHRYDLIAGKEITVRADEQQFAVHIPLILPA